MTITAPGTAPAAAATRTAVVTGIGVVAPNGLGTEEWWSATLRGESGIRPVPDHSTRPGQAPLIGLIPGFEAGDHLPGRLLPQTDRVTRLALVASDWALADSGADPAALPEYGMGVVTSNATGASSSPTARSASCGPRAPSTSASTSPSPGSTRPTPARSRSVTGCAAPAMC